jgi:hypothetical protein
LDDVLVLDVKGYYYFCYGRQPVLAIKPRKERKFIGYGKLEYINNGYYVKGIYGFSNIIGGILSLTTNEFNDIIMEWITNKHPEITDYNTLYQFCKDNSKTFREFQDLFK